MRADTCQCSCDMIVYMYKLRIYVYVCNGICVGIRFYIYQLMLVDNPPQIKCKLMKLNLHQNYFKHKVRCESSTSSGKWQRGGKTEFEFML